MPTTQAQPTIPEPERVKILARQTYINSLLTAMTTNAGNHATTIETQAALIEADLVTIEASMAALDTLNIVATQAAVAAEIVTIRAALAAQAVAIAGVRTTQTTGTHVTALQTCLTDQYNPRLV